VKTLNDAGKLANFKVDAGPENIGIDVNKDDPVGSIVGLFESRGDVVGAFRRQRLRHARRSATRSPRSARSARSAPSASISDPSSRSRSAPARSPARLASSPSCRASGR
jgi:hypothetical protein